MAEKERDLLLARLAVHYKVLDKSKVNDAIKDWRAAGTEQDFGDFLLYRDIVPPQTLAKLIQARDQYLHKQRIKDPRPRPVEVVEETTEETGETGESLPPEPEADPTKAYVQPVEEISAPSAPRLELGPETALEDLLRRAAEIGASDLHVHSGAPIKLRYHGRLMDATRPIERDEAERLIHGVLSDEQKAIVEEHRQLDFSFAISGVGRFRSNCYFQHRGLNGVFRVIPPHAPTLGELGLPESLGRLAEYHQGMVLFTGPAGCGKSSTMAAMVRMINESRPDHILTIEEPIEYVHVPQSCVVNQREVGPHTESFARALRAALREDPDIIVIGELRDLETVSLALTAAETGHLVLGTLHTASTIPTINRLVGVFPPNQQAQIRTMVSESLRAIISQRLVPLADGSGRTPALEVLINNKAIGNLIRDNRTFQIKSILQTAGEQGMYLLDATLVEMVKKGLITREAARREATDPKLFAATAAAADQSQGE